jgi:hypothetical protein
MRRAIGIGHPTGVITVEVWPFGVDPDTGSALRQAGPDASEKNHRCGNRKDLSGQPIQCGELRAIAMRRVFFRGPSHSARAMPANGQKNELNKPACTIASASPVGCNMPANTPVTAAPAANPHR